MGEFEPEDPKEHRPLRWFPNTCALCGRVPTKGHPAGEDGEPEEEPVVLSQCTRCRLVRYCCREHQKEHFPDHKAFCKAFSTVMTTLDTTSAASEGLDGREEFLRRRMEIATAVGGALGRPLALREKEHILLARTCLVCWRDGRGNPLSTCDLCLHGHHCRDRPECAAAFRTLHPRKGKQCTNVAVGMFVNTLRLQIVGGRMRCLPIYIPPTVFKDYIPLVPGDDDDEEEEEDDNEEEDDDKVGEEETKSAGGPSTGDGAGAGDGSGWGAAEAADAGPAMGEEGDTDLSGYVADEPDAETTGVVAKAPASLSSSASPKPKVSAWTAWIGRTEWPSLPPTLMTGMLPVLSYPLTMCHALELAPSVDHLSVESLVIHVLGCKVQVELNSVTRYELLLHTFPSLKSVSIRLIGPDMEQAVGGPLALPGDVDTSFDTGKELLCPACAAAGKRVRIATTGTTYHEYLDRVAAGDVDTEPDDKGARPDLVVAFNSGVHAPDLAESWRPSLEAIAAMSPSPPAVVLTSFTEEEAAGDAATLEAAGLTVSPGFPRPNPFHSPLPILDPTRYMDTYQENGVMLMC